jgi:hypothetical protein
LGFNGFNLLQVDGQTFSPLLAACPSQTAALLARMEERKVPGSWAMFFWELSGEHS